MSPWRRLRRGFGAGLARIGGRLAEIGRRIEGGEQNREHRRWLRDRGDQLARLDYALREDSSVWDVGGFEGQWASDIAGRFACRVDIFEPMPRAAEGLRRRFAANPKIAVHDFALGAADGRLKLALAGDASSLLPGAVAGGSTVEVGVRDIAAYCAETGVGRIDLLKVNIEGGEYVLIERLLESGWIARVENLQVQFHDFVPDAAVLRERLAARLAHTHERVWCYEFVWESWRRRAGGAR